MKILISLFLGVVSAGVYDLAHHVEENSPVGDAEAALKQFNSFCKKNMPGMMLGEEKNDIMTKVTSDYVAKVQGRDEELVILEMGSHAGDGSLSIVRERGFSIAGFQKVAGFQPARGCKL